jgi:hypothetical protein
MADLMAAAILGGAAGLDPHQPSTWTPARVGDSERREQALTDAYADGRADERAEWLPVLGALQEMVHMAELYIEASPGGPIQRARAAIARATGSAA